MMPFSSVAIIEKFALLKIAFCRAPVFSRASWRRTSVMPLGGRSPALITDEEIVFLAMILNALLRSLGASAQTHKRERCRRSLFPYSVSVLAILYVEKQASVFAFDDVIALANVDIQQQPAQYRNGT